MEQNKTLLQALEQAKNEQVTDHSDTDSHISASSIGRTCDEDSDDSNESDASNLSSFDASSFANKVQGKFGKKPATSKGKTIRKPKY